jgi:ABC-type sugar transport system substrate-binding protein
VRPVHFPGANVVWHGIPGVGIEDLPAQRIHRDIVLSIWDLTPEERMAIAEGALVELQIRTVLPHPAVALYVSSMPRDVTDPPECPHG